MHVIPSRRPAPALLSAVVLSLLLPIAAPPSVAAQVPTPESVVGFEPGADYRLLDYEQVVSYFRALDEASDRVAVEEIGETVGGRTMILAFISSAENLERREEHRRIAERLATDGTLSAERARDLAAEGKAVLWIDGGLHSTEVAGSQFPPVFAHRLVTEESETAREIRERVIVMLMPVMNPDGLDIVAEWYRENLGTPFETAPLPVLYHEYVGHDNNRDWFMLTMPESRAVARQLWHRWFPQIVVNHHQTSPFPGRIFIPPFADPVNPHIPPLVRAGINLVGVRMHQRFLEEGKPGAVSRVSFTQWWNGGMRTAPYFHNQVGILTEVALHEYATPRRYPPDSLPSRFRSGLSAERPSTWYPLPWEGGWWRLSDAVEYMVTASWSAAETAADLKDEWLSGINEMARRAVGEGRAGDPFAYVVPLEGQHDPGETVAMLEVLRRGGVRLHRTTGEFDAGGRSYPAGTYVAYAGQPFRAHLMDLMEPQDYPTRRLYPGGPPVTPYDLAGWTLPIQMGVEVRRVDEPFEAPVREVTATELPPPEGGVRGEGPRYLLRPGPNAGYRAVNALLEEGARVGRAVSAFRAEDVDWPPGTWVIRGDRGRLETLAGAHGLSVVATEADPAARRVRRPRVGLYRSWVPNMDEGWTRWVFEGYGFGYETLRDADLRERDLDRYDVVVLPDQSPDRILNGWTEGRMPERYTGGVGAAGAAALERFVREGGTLVALDGAAGFPIRHFGLPVRDSLERLSSREFFIPGSLVRLRPDPADPIAYGMREDASASFVRSRAFEVIPPASAGERRAERRVDVVARYGSDDLLLSGFELGADRHLADRPAVVRLPLGEGRVVLIGFRPQFRGQPRATFKLLFNSLYASRMGELPLESLEEAAEAPLPGR